MSKIITFAFNTKYKEQIQETFSFEQLGINEQLPSDEMKKQIDQLFENWVCDRLNLSYSIVIEEEDQWPLYPLLVTSIKIRYICLQTVNEHLDLFHRHDYT